MVNKTNKQEKEGVQETLKRVQQNCLAHRQYMKDCPREEITLFDEDLKLVEDAYLYLYTLCAENLLLKENLHTGGTAKWLN